MCHVATGILILYMVMLHRYINVLDMLGLHSQIAPAALLSDHCMAIMPEKNQAFCLVAVLIYCIHPLSKTTWQFFTHISKQIPDHQVTQITFKQKTEHVHEHVQYNDDDLTHNDANDGKDESQEDYLGQALQACLDGTMDNLGDGYGMMTIMME